MKWFKGKREAVAVEAPAPRELTGIEKAELERAERERMAEYRLAEEKAADARRMIAKIEQEIGPQLAVLNQLKAQLDPNPWYYYQNALASMRPGQIYPLGPSNLLGSLFGGSFRVQ